MTQRVAIGLLVAVIAQRAPAALLTFSFSGTINTINDPNGFLRGVLETGSAFFGTYSFDSASPDQFPNDPKNGSYATLPPYHVTVGSLVLTSTSAGYIHVINSAGYDAYNAGTTPFSSGGFQISELYIRLSTLSGQALASDQLPLEPPNLEAFSTRLFWLQGRPSGGGTQTDFVASGTIGSITPEPVSLLLVAAGGLLLTGRRRSLRGSAHAVLLLALTAPLSAAPYYGTGEFPRVDDIANVASSPRPSTPLSQSGTELADIVFVIDGSDSISDASFEMEKAGIQNRLVGANALPAAQGRLYRPDGRFRRRLRR